MTDLRIVCAHEAAHTVIHALNPYADVLCLSAVSSTDSGGYCELSMRNGWWINQLKWDYDDECYYLPHKQRVSFNHLTDDEKDALISDMQHYVMGALAGHLFTDIRFPDSNSNSDADEYSEGNDTSTALGVCYAFLDGRKSFDDITVKTIDLLKDSAIAEKIDSLAKVLATETVLNKAKITEVLSPFSVELRPVPRIVRATKV